MPPSQLPVRSLWTFEDGDAYGPEWRTDRQRLDAALDEEWAFNPLLSAGLTFHYRGGLAWDGAAWVEIAAGSVALTDNATNYVERTIGGVVSVNQAGFSAHRLPLWKVTTVAGAVTALVDRRARGTRPPFYTIPLVLDNQTGSFADHHIDTPARLVGIIALGTSVASCSIDFWRCTYAQFDGGATHPVVGDSIVGGNPFVITNQPKGTEATFTGWSRDFAEGDVLRAVVNSTSFTRLTLHLKLARR